MGTWIIIFLIALVLGQIVVWNLIHCAMGQVKSLNWRVAMLEADRNNHPTENMPDPWIPEV